MNAITVKDLTYFYPGAKRPALDKISMSIEKGSFILVTGASGCGKSSLARAMCRLAPDFYGGKISGDIRIHGSELCKLKEKEIPQCIGMVFQNPERQIIMDRTLNEISFGLENIGIPAEEIFIRSNSAIERFGLEGKAHNSTDTLSSGQKQRLALASVMAMSPSILILDEPSSQLDPESTNILKILLKDLQSAGHTIVLFEHRIDSYLPMSDRVIFMNEGKISFQSSRNDFKKQISKHHQDFARSLDILSTGITPTKKSRQAQILEASGIKFSYDRKDTILSDLDLLIPEGIFVSILGKNGSGKTTLLKVISGLVKPISGKVLIKGMDTSKLSLEEISSKIGFLAQNPNNYLFNDTVKQELLYTKNNFAPHGSYPIDDLLDILRLKELSEAYPRDLSTGERQRVALGSVIISDPPLLMLDEPTRGMDAVLKAELGSFLRERAEKENRSILMVTQDENFAGAFSDRILVLKNGKLEEEYHHG